MSLRVDETWNRLLEWTYGSAQSERLAALVLQHEGYRVDPCHPLGGPDGGKDALCVRDGKTVVMAVYFPRGQQTFAEIKKKLEADAAGARRNDVGGIAFVTNQDIRLAERSALAAAIAPLTLDLYHLERVASILDTPAMAPVLKQFLHIDRAIPEVVVRAMTPKSALMLDDCRTLVAFLRTAMNDVRALTGALRRPTLLGAEYDPSFEQFVRNLTIEDGHLHTQLRTFIDCCKAASVVLAEAARLRHFMSPVDLIRAHPLVTVELRRKYDSLLRNLEALYEMICARIGDLPAQ